MKRRDFLKGVGAVTAAAAVPSVFSGLAQAGASGDGSRPNIVFILADDLGYGDPGCFNPESKIPTPNIDSLAQEGIRFTNAHAPGTWCSPSRYGLLTGRFPLRTEIRKIRRTRGIEPDRMTVGSLLQKNGYRTACVGKWHLGFEGGWKDRDWSKPMRGGPVDCGFDYYFGIPASLDIPPYYYIENDRCVAPPTETVAANSSEGVTAIQGAFWREGKMSPGFRFDSVLPTLFDKSAEFIRRQHENRPDQPFFLYLPLSGPHTPWLPTTQFEGQSEAGMYGDFATQVDDGVGRILKLLDRLGLTENTLVFFSSDNGPVWFDADEERYDHKSVGPLRGMKADAWEGGHRMPFVARWPGHIPKGSTSDQVICFTDMLATFADLVGDDLPDEAGVDSFNILPTMLSGGSNEARHGPVVVEDRAIIDGKWKLIQGSGMGGLHRGFDPDLKNSEKKTKRPEGELYNLARDIDESNNLYDERPEMVEQLRAAMSRVKKQGRTRPVD